MKKLLVGSMLFILFLSSCPLSWALNWRNLHQQADQTGLPEAASQAANQPGSIEHLYILGLVYLNLHQDQQAKETFEKISNLDQESIEAKWGQAEVLRRQHQIEQSQTLLSQIIETDPEFSPALISLAYIKYIQMNFKQSVRLALRVLKQGRENVDLSNYVRARLLVGGGKGMIAHYAGPIAKITQGTAVLPNLKKAQKLQPKAAGVLMGLGSFYLLAPPLVGGNIDKAEQYLIQAVEADPLFADAYVRLAQVYRVKGQEDKYKLYLNKALEIDPQNELPWISKANNATLSAPRLKKGGGLIGQ